MKWKAVTQRTRVLGTLAVLSTVGVGWSSLEARGNPCAKAAMLFSSRGHVALALFEPSSAARLVRVQDSDDADDGLTENAAPEILNTQPSVNDRAENGTHKNQVAPCVENRDFKLRIRGLFLVAMILFSLATVYSLQRDRRRYAKRLRGRERRDAIRMRRESNRASGRKMVVQVPLKARDGIAQECACGCGEATTGSQFFPGHAQMLRLELEEKAGGLLALRDLVEEHAKEKPLSEG